MALRQQPLWIRVFAVIGMVATGSVLSSLFLAFGRRSPKPWLSDVPAVGSPDFLQALAGGTSGTVETGGEARLLRNGDQIFPAMLEDLRGAKKTIHFSVYIWQGGQLSRELARVLADR